ncbi:PilW family protein [Thauera humireducens]|uniref:PilW family protein n=1 Tax=Thauera humireducens TaxID=1134435 RepID=UPI00311F0962
MKQTLISQRQQRGLTLVELMIGLLVGMLVIGAVLYVFLGSRLTYKYNDTMGRIQENGRVAIEMIGQDVRMAGFIGCRRLAAYLPPPSATGSISAESIYFSDDFTNAIKTNLGLSELNLADKGFVFSQEIDDQVEGTDSLAVLAGSTEIPSLDSWQMVQLPLSPAKPCLQALRLSPIAVSTGFLYPTPPRAEFQHLPKPSWSAPKVRRSRMPATRFSAPTIPMPVSRRSRPLVIRYAKQVAQIATAMPCDPCFVTETN